MRRSRGASSFLAAALLLVAVAPAGAAVAPCSRGWLALTFDDGPGPQTPAVLDLLAAHDAPSTFFVVGARAAAAPGSIRRMAAERHVVANHTYRHENLTTLSDEAIRSTISATEHAIAAIGVRNIPVVRPPYGATNRRVDQAIRAGGYTSLLWSADSRDWATASSDEVARRAIAGFADGAVILFHDGNSGVQRTLPALPRIIDTARAQGYCFGVIDDAGRVVPPSPVARQVAPPQQLSSIEGANRFATAVEISRAGWPQGTPEVVLATGEHHADALSAAVLAGVVGGPILLTTDRALPPVVADELRRLGTSRAYLVGALSTDVEDGVRALGIETMTLAGADPYATASLVAREAASRGADTSVVMVASGEGFADGLAASVLAAGARHPILLARPGEGPERLAAEAVELGAERTWIIGGQAAVPDQAISGMPGLDRIAGPVRAATAVGVADRAVRMGYDRNPVIASGSVYPDALAGGVLAARLRRPLLITAAGESLSPQVHHWLAANGSSSVLILGGPAAVGAGVRCQLRTGLDLSDGCQG